MSKYINAEDLKDKITAQFGTRYEMSCFDIVSIIMDFPSADVRENIHGEWIKVTNGRGGHECSLCGNYALNYQSGAENLSDFCPNCGADMREKRETI